MLKIGGLSKHSLIDYPGRIASVIFTRGCDFRCPFCHNPDLIYREGESISISEIVETIKERKNWIDGIVITGGEALINYDIVDLLKYLKENIKLPVKLDTNGNNPNILKTVIDENLVDFIAMDIKTVLIKEKYSEITGRDIELERIVNSINIIRESGIDHQFRTTVIPGVHTLDDLIAIKEFLKDESCYKLQNFSNQNPYNPEYKKITPYTNNEFEEIKRKVFDL